MNDANSNGLRTRKVCECDAQRLQKGEQHGGTYAAMRRPKLRPTENNYIPYNIDELPWWKVLLKFVGPGAMVAVGYIDPGNWATDLKGGSQYYYNLLFAILLANVCAVFLQSLTVKAGIVTGNDLAQLCRLHCNKYLNYFLYATAEAAIIATDIAEVIGSAIAFYLLFGLPLPWGVAITGFDVLLILAGFDSKRLKYFEFAIILLVAVVAGCFISLISKTDPNWGDVFLGFIPRGKLFTDSNQLFIMIGIIGATVMPHNLYLHSNLVLYRYNPSATVYDCLGFDGNDADGDSKPKLSEPSLSIRKGCSSTEHPTRPYIAVGMDAPSAVNSTTPMMNGNSSQQSFSEQPDSNNNAVEFYSVEPIGNDFRDTPISPTSNTRTQESPAGDEPLSSRPGETSVLAATSTYSVSEISPDGFSLAPVEEAKEYKIRHMIHKRLIRNNLRYSYVDTVVSLTFALMINCMILIVSASAFYKKGHNDVESIQSAYNLLDELISTTMAKIFAFALLCSGQSSTVTGTIAGQIVMNGFLSGTGKIQMIVARKPWVRRLVTRLVAIIPAMGVSLAMGMDGIDKLLVISQVILSFQLPFAMWPLIYITSRDKFMTVTFECETNDSFSYLGNVEALRNGLSRRERSEMELHGTGEGHSHNSYPLEVLNSPEQRLNNIGHTSELNLVTNEENRYVDSGQSDRSSSSADIHVPHEPIEVQFTDDLGEFGLGALEPIDITVDGGTHGLERSHSPVVRSRGSGLSGVRETSGARSTSRSVASSSVASAGERSMRYETQSYTNSRTHMIVLVLMGLLITGLNVVLVVS